PRPALQKLYIDLSQTRAAYDSVDFSNPGQARFYSKRPPRTQSVAIFLPDRVLVAEEWAGIALSDYLEKVREIAGRVLRDLGVAAFGAQTVTLRSTFALTHFQDARQFLLDHACQQANRILPHFNRPILTGGLRFVLPETAEHAGNLNVLIESFRQSHSEVFVEVKGIFNQQNFDRETLAKAEDNIRTCRGFITGSVFPFLNQYDLPHEDLV
ncbi:MAG: hypothetical protein AAB353_03305, partial [Candidatus Hydrogenedentota bacterium]